MSDLLNALIFCSLPFIASFGMYAIYAAKWKLVCAYLFFLILLIAAFYLSKQFPELQ